MQCKSKDTPINDFGQVTQLTYLINSLIILFHSKTCIDPYHVFIIHLVCVFEMMTFEGTTLNGKI